MTGRKVRQEAEVLAATVTLEPRQHHQWDVESYVFKQFRPIVHVLLHCIDSDLHLSVGFYIASDLSPQALDGSFALDQGSSVLYEFSYLAL